jgi:hypothetical protein
MRNEVYSWRLSSELKSDLEREARARKLKVSSILDMAVRDWLKNSRLDTGSDEEQRRLHAAAASSLGVLAGGNPRRSQTARVAIRSRLARRCAR